MGFFSGNLTQGKLTKMNENKNIIGYGTGVLTFDSVKNILCVIIAACFRCLMTCFITELPVYLRTFRKAHTFLSFELHDKFCV